MRNIYRFRTALVVLGLLVGGSAVFAQGQSSTPTFKLDAETNQFNPGPEYPSYPSYPAPQMIQQAPRQAPVPHPPPIQAHIQQTAQPPVQMHATAAPPGVLPNQYLGNWKVSGQRVNVRGSTPQYQSGYERVFGVTTHNTWDITGRPGQYGISSDAGMQQIQLGQITNDTAYFRYQHPVYMNQNGQMVAMPTVAQEAVVMQASPDGHSFRGMLKITIVKPGEGPRGTVTYNLAGSR